MPLDPQVAAFLEEYNGQNPPRLEDLSPQQARVVMEAQRAMFGLPPPVDRTEDHEIPGPAGRIPMRLFGPRAGDPLPLVVYYHGGGWVLGSIGTHECLCARLANAAGCLVASVDYRLAPEHKYPAAVDDAVVALQWVHGQAAALGSDPDLVMVAGDSAGGNLAAVAAQSARDRSAIPLRLQVLIYPITDYRFDRPSYRENGEGYLLTRPVMEWFWGHYLSDPRQGEEPYASPLRATDLTGLPPALVITAEYDPLRDEGAEYARRLAEAKVPVQYSCYPGMIHGFLGQTLLFDKARLALDEIAAAIRRAVATGSDGRTA